MKRFLCATLLLQGIAAIAGAEEGYRVECLFI